MKPNSRPWLYLLCVIGLSHLALAEEVPPSTGPISGLGFSAGAIAGSGLAYRKTQDSFLGENWGYHLSGIAWGSRTNWFGDFGFEALRTVSRRGNFRFYVPIGASIYAETSATSLWLGSGYGIEWEIKQTLLLSFELPLQLQINAVGGWRIEGIYPIPGASIIYLF